MMYFYISTSLTFEKKSYICSSLAQRVELVLFNAYQQQQQK